MRTILTTDKACGHCALAIPCLQQQKFPSKVQRMYRVRYCNRCFCLLFNIYEHVYVCTKMRHGQHAPIPEGVSIHVYMKNTRGIHTVTKGCAVHYKTVHPLQMIRRGRHVTAVGPDERYAMFLRGNLGVDTQDCAHAVHIVEPPLRHPDDEII
jgi:hypothetical protein